MRDPFDTFIINLEKGLGYFSFPKDVLIKKGIISKEGKGGKRAFRIYPPWAELESTQAKKTQAWQKAFFVS